MNEGCDEIHDEKERGGGGKMRFCQGEEGKDRKGRIVPSDPQVAGQAEREFNYCG
jgi:hypothetical protein